MDDLKRQLEWDVSVVDALENANRFGGGKLVLRHQHPASLVLASSSCSLYDNVNSLNQSVNDSEVDTESPVSLFNRYITTVIDINESRVTGFKLNNIYYYELLSLILF